MDREALLRAIIEDTKTLVQQAADSRRKTISLSPETAHFFEQAPGDTTLWETSKTHEAEAPAGAEDASAALDTLAAEVSACTRCGLCETRTQTVFGQGNPRARLVFVGEAPGADEDRQGLPFVGAAGQFLNRIIERGMKARRSDFYICNVLKCRPPNNRDPRADEVEQCEPYLKQQLALIQPLVICALGGHAAKTLLKTGESTGRLRGQWHFYAGIPVRVTYHPSYLLRCQDDPDRFKQEKNKVWQDIQAVMRILSGEETPSPPPSSRNPELLG